MYMYMYMHVHYVYYQLHVQIKSDIGHFELLLHQDGWAGVDTWYKPKLSGGSVTHIYLVGVAVPSQRKLWGPTLHVPSASLWCNV